MVAAKLANMKHGGDRKSRDQAPNLELDPPVSVEQAAESLKVGKSNVYKAKQVQAARVPALVDVVEVGEVSLIAEVVK
jgi:hypothetical protein